MKIFSVLLVLFSSVGCYSADSDNRPGRPSGDMTGRVRVEAGRFYRGDRPLSLFGQGYELAVNRQTTHLGFDYRDEAAWYGRFGLNLTRFYPLIVSDIGRDFRLPFVRLPSGKFDLTDFDPEYYSGLRNLCQFYGRYGIVCLLQFWHWPSFRVGPDGPWDNCVYNPTNNINRFTNSLDGGIDFAARALQYPRLLAHQTAYIDRLLDATADLDNVIYEIAHEYWPNTYSPVASRWVDSIVGHIRRYEGEKGMDITLGNMPATDEEYRHETSLPGLDFLDISSHPAGIHYRTPEELFGIVKGLYVSGKPIIAAEVRPAPDVRQNSERVRQEQRRRFWALFMAGGSGAATSLKLVLPFSHYRLERAYKDTNRWERYLSHLHRFIDTLANPDRLEPVEALMESAWQLETPGTEYVLYLWRDDRAWVDLSAADHRFAYRWYDPRKGSFRESWWVSGGGIREFVCPWNGDAVLHIWKP